MACIERLAFARYLNFRVTALLARDVSFCVFVSTFQVEFVVIYMTVSSKIVWLSSIQAFVENILLKYAA